MITVKRLFRERLKENAVFQWKAIHMAFDWVVALYIVVPAMLVIGYHYIQAFKELPVILRELPMVFYLLFLYIVSTMRSIRYFIEAADQVVLTKAPGWIQGLKKRGLLYSVFLQILQTVLLIGLLLPVFLPDYSGPQIAALGLLTLVVSMNIILIRQRVDQRTGWKIWLYRAGIALLGWVMYGVAALLILSYSFAWVLPLAVVFGASFVYIWKRKLSSMSDLEKDIQRDYKARMKIAGLWLMYAAPVRPKPTRVRPLLFRSSNRIFKKRNSANGLAEAYIKLFFRSPSEMQLYFQVIGICMFGVFLVPMFFKWLLWFFGSWVILYMAKIKVEDVQHIPMVSILSIDETAVGEAVRKAVMIIAMPGIVLFSFGFGLLIFPWWGAVLLAIGGGVLNYSLSPMMLIGPRSHTTSS